MSPEEQAFWDEVKAALVVWPTIEPEYRLYYDTKGRIYLCTNSPNDHPASGDYVVVDQETYQQHYLYRVTKGQLIKIETDLAYRRQLEPGSTGFQVVKAHAGLIVESGETYTETEFYERPNY